MSTTFLTTGVWTAITQFARRNSRSAWVAVPYFGKRGNSLLPLNRGSSLVVNASEIAVKTGQTSPAALLSLLRKGVRIYSDPNLHAKVYVFGSTAFVGSANASASSAEALVEAVVRTTDRSVVRSTRSFVQDLCTAPIGPTELERLAPLYREPRVGRGRGKGLPNRAQGRPPRIWLSRVSEGTMPPDAAEVEDEVAERARRKRERRSYIIADAFWSGSPPYRLGDTLIELYELGSGKVVVAPPGRVCHLERWRGPKRSGTFVCYEREDTRRISVERLAKVLGRGAKQRLLRAGPLGEGEFRTKLLAYWASRA
jgi:hypothetical protein